MPFFTNDGVKIYYEIEGEGPPVVMIHGWGASLGINWKATNWVRHLKEDYQLILLDCRGHGKSDKPLDPDQYGYKNMSSDITELVAHLSIETANFFGYSMGSGLTFYLLLKKPQLFKSAILGGYVFRMPEDAGRTLSENQTLKMIEALKAESYRQVRDPMGRGFRRFAETMGGNLEALAGAMSTFLESPFGSAISTAEVKTTLKSIKIPIMTVVGSDEFETGDKSLLAQLVPDACHFQIQGKDHLSAVPNPKFKMVVKAFLDYVNIN